MTEFQSLLFYIISFVISCLIMKIADKVEKSSSKNKLISKILFAISLMIPILIGGLRYNVGTDYTHYKNLYFRTFDYSLSDILNYKDEILFLFIVKIAYFLGSYQFVFTLMSSLTIYFVYIGIKYFNDKISISLAFFLYLLLFFTNSFNLVKQALAIAIILYAYRFICQHEFKKFMLCIIIASLFHTSALLFIPFYYVENNKKSISLKPIYIVVAIFVVFNLAYLINFLSSLSIFQKYVVYQNSFESNNKEIFAKLFMLVPILLNRKKLIKYDNRNSLLIFFCVIEFIFLLSGFYSPFVKRFAAYFGIGDVVLYSYLPKIVKYKKNSLISNLFLIGYSLSVFILTVYVLHHANIIPYNFYFNYIN